MMKRIFQISVILVGLALFAMMSAMGGLLAQDNDMSECTLATVEGTYTFAGHGSVAMEEGMVVPYAEAGVWTLDGAGNAEGIFSGSMDGMTFAGVEAFNGSYEMIANCVYHMVDNSGIEFTLYAVPESDTLTYYSAGVSGVLYP